MLSTLESKSILSTDPEKMAEASGSSQPNCLYLLHEVGAKDSLGSFAADVEIPPVYDFVYVDFLAPHLPDSSALAAAREFAKALTITKPLVVGVSTDSRVAPALSYLVDAVENGPASAGKPAVHASRSDLLGSDENGETDAVQGISQTLLHLNGSSLSELFATAGNSRAKTSETARANAANTRANVLIGASAAVAAAAWLFYG